MLMAPAITANAKCICCIMQLPFISLYHALMLSYWNINCKEVPIPRILWLGTYNTTLVGFVHDSFLPQKSSVSVWVRSYIRTNCFLISQHMGSIQEKRVQPINTNIFHVGTSCNGHNWNLKLFFLYITWIILGIWLLPIPIQDINLS